MIKKLLLSFITVLFSIALVSAQPHTHHNAKTTTGDISETYYDVKHLKFNLNFADTTLFISGDVTTTAQVTASLLSVYTFELDTLMIIDSAKVNGAVLPVVATGDSIRMITLPTALSSGDVFTAQIFYHGQPPAGSGFFNGVTHAVTAAGSNMVFTVSDPYVAKNWWPAKQCIDDKIDSVDMWVTVPAGQVVASNGLLHNIDSISNPGYYRYQWSTHYPIDYYLISVTVGPYVIDTSYIHFAGSIDSMLIQNFFLDTATFYPAFKSNFDSIRMIMAYYDTVYGRYPFWQEKYGMNYTTLPGGMEHQTMTTIGVTSVSVIAHELCHQWFGDHVTYNRWGDVWLSEAFATHSEDLFEEHFHSAAAALAYRKTQHNYAMSAPGGSVFVTDTSSSNTLFDQRLVYDKGAAVVRMLRFLAPADSTFFNVLKAYQQTYAFGLGSEEGLQSIAETQYGISLDTFFNQWIYGQGYPKYAIKWDQVGSTVYVRLIQTTSSPASVPLFSTPLELQFHSATADTIVRVYNNADTQVYVFDWSPTMTTVYLDPNAWVLCKLNGLVGHDTTLSISNEAPAGIEAYPNPAKNYWWIDQLPTGYNLSLTDIAGHTMWTGRSTPGTTTIPAANLARGTYLLKATNGLDTQSVKLVHW